MVGELELIKKVESNNYKILCDEVEKEFASVWLPSHDLEHHKRVWYFAKQIVLSYAESGFSFSYEFIEALMFSVFFHDVGLTRTLDFEHGVESANLAKSFMNKLPVNLNPYKQDLLYAIEKHDNKEYLNVKVESNKPSIYSILTVADDLDAFGAIGLYRYFEIYFLRGISTHEVSGAIQDNLNKRFEFVDEHLKFDKALHEKHYQRYKKAIVILLDLKPSNLLEISKIIHNKKSLEHIPLMEINSTELRYFASKIETEIMEFKSI